jgi:uncharacterized protein (DUF3820 family)
MLAAIIRNPIPFAKYNGKVEKFVGTIEEAK